jgi:hypothetical protein
MQHMSYPQALFEGPKSTHTFFKLRPCALWIVIDHASLRGYCDVHIFVHMYQSNLLQDITENNLEEFRKNSVLNNLFHQIGL